MKAKQEESKLKIDSFLKPTQASQGAGGYRPGQSMRFSGARSQTMQSVTSGSKSSPPPSAGPHSETRGPLDFILPTATTCTSSTTPLFQTTATTNNNNNNNTISSPSNINNINNTNATSSSSATGMTTTAASGNELVQKPVNGEPQQNCFVTNASLDDSIDDSVS